MFLFCWFVEIVVYYKLGSLIFSTLCLQFVEISSYQVARASTVLFSVTFEYFLLQKVTTGRRIMACLIIIAGFCFGSFDTTKFTLYSATLGVLASAIGALFMICAKKSQGFYTSPLSALLPKQLATVVLVFPILILSSETQNLSQLWVSLFPPPMSNNDIEAVSNVDLLSFCSPNESFFDPNSQSCIYFPFICHLSKRSVFLMSLSASLLGTLFVTLAQCFVLQKLSATSCNIVGYVKSCVQSFGGVILFGEHLSFQASCGLLLVLLGSAFYSLVPPSSTPSSSVSSASQGSLNDSFLSPSISPLRRNSKLKDVDLLISTSVKRNFPSQFSQILSSRANARNSVLTANHSDKSENNHVNFIQELPDADNLTDISLPPPASNIRHRPTTSFIPISSEESKKKPYIKSR